MHSTLLTLRDHRHLRTMVNGSLLVLLLFACLLVQSTARAAGNTYYVAPTGLDGNSGSFSRPFQHIQKCATFAHAGDTCVIRAGTYRETVTPTSSGTSGNPITFQPYNNEQVTISGTERVTTAWSSYQNAIYRTTISLNPQLFAPQIFVDGSVMTEARWPNAGPDPLRPVLATARLGSSPSVIYDPTLTQGSNFWNGATVQIWGHDAYGAQTGEITTSAPGMLTFRGAADACPFLCTTAGTQYFLTNSLNALDQGREWFYDNTNTLLYLQTSQSDSPSAHTVEVKQRDYAFDLSNRAYITLKNLCIFASTITSNAQSNNLLIDGLYARHLSQTHDILPQAQGYGFDFLQSRVTITGIQLRGTQNTLKNSDIGNSSGSGLVLEGSGHVVANNLIHDVDYQGTYSPAINAAGNSLSIHHNTLYRTGRDAILSSSTTNTDISYNNIFNTQMLNRDSGSIYICCGNSLDGTVIHHNQIHDTQVNPLVTMQETYGFHAAGIYLDNSTSNTVVHHNVVWNMQSTGILLNGNEGHDNKIYNNSSGPGQWRDLDGCNCSGTQVINNLFRNETTSNGWSNATYANNLLTTDPRYVNEGALDFHLQSNSPALNAGQVVAPYTDGYANGAPDIGAYEYGGQDWSAGSSNNAGILAIPLLYTTQPGNGQVTVNWKPVQYATGYKVKYGTASGQYTTTLDAGNTNSLTITGLTPQQRYFFTVSAYKSGQESLNSTETFEIPHGATRNATSTIFAGSYDDTSFTVNRKNYIEYLWNNNWVRYNSVDFGSGVSSFIAQVGVADAYAGQTIEVHLDSTTGPTIGTLTVQATGEYNNFSQQAAAVSGASGVHDVYLVFRDALSSDFGVGSLQNFTFSAQNVRAATARIEAEQYQDKAGNISLEPNNASLGHLDKNNWAAYQNIDFGSGVSTLTVNLAVAPDYAGQPIELHLGSPNGKLIGTLTPQSTGDWSNFTTQSTSISGASGLQTLYFVVKGSDTLSNGAATLDWFNFS